MDRVKLSVIISTPSRPIEFESAFPALLDAVGLLPGMLGIEVARVLPRTDGGPAGIYRTLDLYFDSYRSALRAGDGLKGRMFLHHLAEAGGVYSVLISHVERHTCNLQDAHEMEAGVNPHAAAVP